MKPSGTPSSTFRVIDLLTQGIDRMQEVHGEKEKTKKGILRAGNSGLKDDNSFTGQCPRRAYVRAMGLEVDPPDHSTELMFAAGRTNEDSWVETLKHSWDGEIRCEEEVPVKWETKNGTLVTGRPDVVLYKEEAPVTGLELKLVSSVWTAREVLNDKPKLPHLIQAAHYSWQVGCPFELWYTSRTNFVVAADHWMEKHFPKKGEPNSEFCEYNEKGQIKGLVPFVKGFELRFKGKKKLLQFRPIDVDRSKHKRNLWQDTIISIERLVDYYEFISKMTETNELGERPKNMKYDGSKMNWSLCDERYCPLTKFCDKYEDKGVKAWLDAIKSSV